MHINGNTKHNVWRDVKCQGENGPCLHRRQTESYFSVKGLKAYWCGHCEGTEYMTEICKENLSHGFELSLSDNMLITNAEKTQTDL